MKRSKFTSFLFSMVFGLFITAGLSAQAGSADCQDEVNITLGDNCDFAVDSLLINSWKPSCLYIKDADDNVLVSVGAGTEDCDCAIMVDSVHGTTTMDTTIKFKTVTAWKQTCSGTDTYFVLSSDNVPSHVTVGGFAPTPVSSSDLSKCTTGATLTVDTTLSYFDTTIMSSTTYDTTSVARYNEFSHTTPLQWYPGAVIATGTGTTMTGSGTKIPLGADATASYTYEAYNPDCSNWCWGTVNFEYNLTVNTPGRADTVECSDFVTYTRGNGYVATNPSAAMFPRSVDSIATILNVDSVGGKITYSVDGDVTSSGDMCNDFVHIRTTTIDHPNDKVADYAGPTDTLVVQTDGFHWPDKVLTVQCDLISDFSPAGIAEYFAQCETGVITKGQAATALDSIFGSQYKANPTALTLTGFGSTAAANADALCEKIVAAADYNNMGVRRAFPYVTNNNELVDEWLRRKLRDLESSGNLTGLTADHYTVDSLWVPINSTVCNWAASYWDHEINVCEGEKKILRTWDVVDWCDGSIQNFVQTIHVVDDSGPSIFVSGGTFKADDPWSCARNMPIPTPTLVDACGSASVVKVEFNGAASRVVAGKTVDYAPGQAISFPVGSNTVKYYADDDCGNRSSVTITIVIEDKFPPVAICTDEVRVTLTGTADSEGVAKIHKDDIDGGSFAGCDDGIVTKIIRKSAVTDLKAQLIAARLQQDDEAKLDFGAPFPGFAIRLSSFGLRDAIELDCDDVGSVDVILFVYNTRTGYYSWCWSTVTVENKLPPVIVCEDITIDCNEAIHPDWLGYPHYYAVCGEVDLTWEDEDELDDLCYEGKITRTWTDNVSGASCVQVITVSAATGQTAFNPTSIKWPLHNTGETLEERGIPSTEIIIYDNNDHDVCTEFTYDEYNTFRTSNKSSYSIVSDVMKGCTMDDAFECTIGGLNEPTWTDPTCGLVGMTSTEEEFTFNDGVCYKRLIHWVVIDWCIYDPKDGDNADADNVWYIKDRCRDDAYFRFDSGVDVDGYYN